MIFGYHLFHKILNATFVYYIFNFKVILKYFTMFIYVIIKINIYIYIYVYSLKNISQIV
jgi:hypothetical protein